MLKPVILQPRTKLVETNKKRAHIFSITGNVNTVNVAELLSPPLSPHPSSFKLPWRFDDASDPGHQTSFPWQNNIDKGEGLRIVEIKMVLCRFLLQGGGEGGSYSTKLYTGMLRPEVQTLTLHPFVYHFWEKKYPFRRKVYPFHIPTEQVLLNFSFENQKPLKYLDDSAVRCVC